MIRVFKSSNCWHMVDTSQSINPFVYDDIELLLEDLKFLLEAYNV